MMPKDESLLQSQSVVESGMSDNSKTPPSHRGGRDIRHSVRAGSFIESERRVSPRSRTVSTGLDVADYAIGAAQYAAECNSQKTRWRGSLSGAYSTPFSKDNAEAKEQDFGEFRQRAHSSFFPPNVSSPYGIDLKKGKIPSQGLPGLASSHTSGQLPILNLPRSISLSSLTSNPSSQLSHSRSYNSSLSELSESKNRVPRIGVQAPTISPDKGMGNIILPFFEGAAASHSTSGNVSVSSLAAGRMSPSRSPRRNDASDRRYSKDLTKTPGSDRSEERTNCSPEQFFDSEDFTSLIDSVSSTNAESASPSSAHMPHTHPMGMALSREQIMHAEQGPEVSMFHGSQFSSNEVRNRTVSFESVDKTASSFPAKYGDSERPMFLDTTSPITKSLSELPMQSGMSPSSDSRSGVTMVFDMSSQSLYDNLSLRIDRSLSFNVLVSSNSLSYFSHEPSNTENVGSSASRASLTDEDSDESDNETVSRSNDVGMMGVFEQDDIENTSSPQFGIPGVASSLFSQLASVGDATFNSNIKGAYSMQDSTALQSTLKSLRVGSEMLNPMEMHPTAVISPITPLDDEMTPSSGSNMLQSRDLESVPEGHALATIASEYSAPVLAISPRYLGDVPDGETTVTTTAASTVQDLEGPMSTHSSIPSLSTYSLPETQVPSMAASPRPLELCPSLAPVISFVKQRHAKLSSNYRLAPELVPIFPVQRGEFLWQKSKGSNAIACGLCEKPFTLLRRKHHCRGCGALLCSNCTPFEPSLGTVLYNIGLTRMCVFCNALTHGRVLTALNIQVLLALQMDDMAYKPMDSIEVRQTGSDALTMRTVTDKGGANGKVPKAKSAKPIKSGEYIRKGPPGTAKLYPLRPPMPHQTLDKLMLTPTPVRHDPLDNVLNWFGAVVSGDIFEVKLRLACGQDPNEIDPNPGGEGYGALHVVLSLLSGVVDAVESASYLAHAQSCLLRYSRQLQSQSRPNSLSSNYPYRHSTDASSAPTSAVVSTTSSPVPPFSPLAVPNGSANGSPISIPSMANPPSGLLSPRRTGSPTNVSGSGNDFGSFSQGIQYPSFHPSRFESLSAQRAYELMNPMGSGVPKELTDVSAASMSFFSPVSLALRQAAYLRFIASNTPEAFQPNMDILSQLPFPYNLAEQPRIGGYPPGTPRLSASPYASPMVRGSPMSPMSPQLMSPLLGASSSAMSSAPMHRMTSNSANANAAPASILSQIRPRANPAERVAPASPLAKSKATNTTTVATNGALAVQGASGTESWESQSPKRELFPDNHMSSSLSLPTTTSATTTAEVPVPKTLLAPVPAPLSTRPCNANANAAVQQGLPPGSPSAAARSAPRTPLLSPLLTSLGSFVSAAANKLSSFSLGSSAGEASLSSLHSPKKSSNNEPFSLLASPVLKGTPTKGGWNAMANLVPLDFPAGTASAAGTFLSASPVDLILQSPVLAALRASFEKSAHAMVSALLFGGADPNHAGFNGKTPLHLAATYGNAEIVKCLMHCGAMENVQDKNGLTPYDLAVLRVQRAENILYNESIFSASMDNGDSPTMAGRKAHVPEMSPAFPSDFSPNRKSYRLEAMHLELKTAKEVLALFNPAHSTGANTTFAATLSKAKMFAALREQTAERIFLRKDWFEEFVRTIPAPSLLQPGSKSKSTVSHIDKSIATSMVTPTILVREFEQEFCSKSLHSPLPEPPSPSSSPCPLSLEEATTSKAQSLPIPPTPILLNAGLTMLDPAAQSLQANLLAVQAKEHRNFAHIMHQVWLRDFLADPLPFRPVNERPEGRKISFMTLAFAACGLLSPRASRVFVPEQETDRFRICLDNSYLKNDFISPGVLNQYTVDKKKNTVLYPPPILPVAASCVYSLLDPDWVAKLPMIGRVWAKGHPKEVPGDATDAIEDGFRYMQGDRYEVPIGLDFEYESDEEGSEGGCSDSFAASESMESFAGDTSFVYTSIVEEFAHMSDASTETVLHGANSAKLNHEVEVEVPLNELPEASPEELLHGKKCYSTDTLCAEVEIPVSQNTMEMDANAETDTDAETPPNPCNESVLSTVTTDPVVIQTALLSSSPPVVPLPAKHEFRLPVLRIQSPSYSKGVEAPSDSNGGVNAFKSTSTFAGGVDSYSDDLSTDALNLSSPAASLSTIASDPASAEFSHSRTPEQFISPVILGQYSEWQSHSDSDGSQPSQNSPPRDTSEGEGENNTEQAGIGNLRLQMPGSRHSSPTGSNGSVGKSSGSGIGSDHRHGGHPLLPRLERYANFSTDQDQTRSVSSLEPESRDVTKTILHANALRRSSSYTSPTSILSGSRSASPSEPMRSAMEPDSPKDTEQGAEHADLHTLGNEDGGVRAFAAMLPPISLPPLFSPPVLSARDSLDTLTSMDSLFLQHGDFSTPATLLPPLQTMSSINSLCVSDPDMSDSFNALHYFTSDPAISSPEASPAFEGDECIPGSFNVSQVIGIQELQHLPPIKEVPAEQEGAKAIDGREVISLDLSKSSVNIFAPVGSSASAANSTDGDDSDSDSALRERSEKMRILRQRRNLASSSLSTPSSTVSSFSSQISSQSSVSSTKSYPKERFVPSHPVPTFAPDEYTPRSASSNGPPASAWGSSSSSYSSAYSGSTVSNATTLSLGSSARSWSSGSTATIGSAHTVGSSSNVSLQDTTDTARSQPSHSAPGVLIEEAEQGESDVRNLPRLSIKSLPPLPRAHLSPVTEKADAMEESTEDLNAVLIANVSYASTALATSDSDAIAKLPLEDVCLDFRGTLGISIPGCSTEPKECLAQSNASPDKQQEKQHGKSMILAPVQLPWKSEDESPFIPELYCDSENSGHSPTAEHEPSEFGLSACIPGDVRPPPLRGVKHQVSDEDRAFMRAHQISLEVEDYVKEERSIVEKTRLEEFVDLFRKVIDTLKHVESGEESIYKLEQLIRVLLLCVHDGFFLSATSGVPKQTAGSKPEPPPISLECMPKELSDLLEEMRGIIAERRKECAVNGGEAPYDAASPADSSYSNASYFGSGSSLSTVVTSSPPDASISTPVSSSNTTPQSSSIHLTLPATIASSSPEFETVKPTSRRATAPSPSLRRVQSYHLDTPNTTTQTDGFATPSSLGGAGLSRIASASSVLPSPLDTDLTSIMYTDTPSEPTQEAFVSKLQTLQLHADRKRQAANSFSFPVSPAAPGDSLAFTVPVLRQTRSFDSSLKGGATTPSEKTPSAEKTPTLGKVPSRGCLKFSSTLSKIGYHHLCVKAPAMQKVLDIISSSPYPDANELPVPCMCQNTSASGAPSPAQPPIPRAMPPLPRPASSSSLLSTPSAAITLDTSTPMSTGSTGMGVAAGAASPGNESLHSGAGAFATSQCLCSYGKDPASPFTYRQVQPLFKSNTFDSPGTFPVTPLNIIDGVSDHMSTGHGLEGGILGRTAEVNRNDVTESQARGVAMVPLETSSPPSIIVVDPSNVYFSASGAVISSVDTSWSDGNALPPIVPLPSVAAPVDSSHSYVPHHSAPQLPPPNSSNTFLPAPYSQRLYFSRTGIHPIHQPHSLPTIRRSVSFNCEKPKYHFFNAKSVPDTRLGRVNSLGSDCLDWSSISPAGNDSQSSTPNANGNVDGVEGDDQSPLGDTGARSDSDSEFSDGNQSDDEGDGPDRASSGSRSRRGGRRASFSSYHMMDGAATCRATDGSPSAEPVRPIRSARADRLQAHGSTPTPSASTASTASSWSNLEPPAIPDASVRVPITHMDPLASLRAETSRLCESSGEEEQGPGSQPPRRLRLSMPTATVTATAAAATANGEGVAAPVSIARRNRSPLVPRTRSLPRLKLSLGLSAAAPLKIAAPKAQESDGAGYSDCSDCPSDKTQGENSDACGFDSDSEFPNRLSLRCGGNGSGYDESSEDDGSEGDCAPRPNVGISCKPLMPCFFMDMQYKSSSQAMPNQSATQ